MYQTTEGYRVVAVMPKSEAALSRNISVGVTTAMQIMVFAALFIMIFILVKRLVVDNIHQINNSLPVKHLARQLAHRYRNETQRHIQSQQINPLLFLHHVHLINTE